MGKLLRKTKSRLNPACLLPGSETYVPLYFGNDLKMLIISGMLPANKACKFNKRLFRVAWNTIQLQLINLLPTCIFAFSVYLTLPDWAVFYLGGLKQTKK